MELRDGMLRTGELATLKLRARYEQLGYQKYRMGRFEEYSLYAQNKNFLAGEKVIAFTDLDGRLMALKPDVTLSILKNARAAAGEREKLYYLESVYRESRESHTYREISQMGLEVLGLVDQYAAAEVLALAEQSLAEISPDYLLELSDMDFVVGLLSELGLPEGRAVGLLALIRQKNADGLRRAAEELALSGPAADTLAALPGLYGPLTETVARARPLAVNAVMSGALDRLEQLWDTLRAMGWGKRVQLDLSMANDMDYYNGIIFQGYLEQLPRSVLAGGRYDALVRRMGKEGGGIGFALYLSELERLPGPAGRRQVDALLLYPPEADPVGVARRVEELAAQGLRVRAEVRRPEGVHYEKLFHLTENGLEEVPSC